MHRYAIRPSTNEKWQIWDLLNKRAVPNLDRIADRAKASEIVRNLNANRIKRDEAMAAGL